jgi:hypothetical protein
LAIGGREVASQSVRGEGYGGPLRCAGAHGRRWPSALSTQKPLPVPLATAPRKSGEWGRAGVASGSVGEWGGLPSEGLYRLVWGVGA